MRGDALVSLQVVMAAHGGAGFVFFDKWWRPVVVVLLVRICKAAAAVAKQWQRKRFQSCGGCHDWCSGCRDWCRCCLRDPWLTVVR